MAFDSVAAAISAIARGELVVVADDAARENEGDLILAAQHATPERSRSYDVGAQILTDLNLTTGRAA